MVRYLPILLGTCVAIVSGVIAAVGVRALAHHEKVTQQAVEISYDDFFSERPENTYHFKLNSFRYGVSVYPEPFAPDGEWESVYVCLFSSQLERLPSNYTSVIVEIKNAKGSEDVTKILKSGELDIFYFPSKQKLPSNIYNRMAQKYRGLQFGHCLHCESGGPPPSPEFGNNCINLGIIGVTLSIVGVIGFYLLKMLRSLVFRKRDKWFDEEEEQFNNKAGLPSA